MVAREKQSYVTGFSGALGVSGKIYQPKDRQAKEVNENSCQIIKPNILPVLSMQKIRTEIDRVDSAFAGFNR